MKINQFSTFIICSMVAMLSLASCSNNSKSEKNNSIHSDSEVEKDKSTIVGKTYIGSGYGAAAGRCLGIYFIDEKNCLKFYKDSYGNTYSNYIAYKQDKNIIDVDGDSKWGIKLEIVNKDILKEPGNNSRTLFRTETFDRFY